LAALLLAIALGWTSAAAAASHSCDDLPAFPSQRDSTATTITMVNTGQTRVFIRWIDFEGAEKSYTILGPGEKYEQRSFRTHAWIARDERSRCVAAFISEADGEAWTIDARAPADRPYEDKQIEGFAVRVSPEWERDPELRQRCLDILSESLRQLARIVPAPAWGKLKQVPIWLDYEEVHFINGAYLPSRLWLIAHGMDPERAKSVLFTRNLANLIGGQPNLVLHELAHAYHDLVLTERDPAIVAAYERAQASGLYDSVERNDGTRGRAYALTNAREFFAELSEAYFGRNDFFPYTREQLQTFDPESFKVVAEAWNCP
jgi:hypothetical protein